MVNICWPHFGQKCVKIWVLGAHSITYSSSGWVPMTNIFSKFKNMNNQLSNAPPNMFLRYLVIFLPYATYAFEFRKCSISNFVYDCYNYANLASFHKMLISSQAMMYRIRMFNTVLEHLKVILLVFQNSRNIRVSLGNTWSISVVLSVDRNVWKYEYYADIWARVVLNYEFLWPIFFRNSKEWIISFLTHYQPWFCDA